MPTAEQVLSELEADEDALRLREFVRVERILPEILELEDGLDRLVRLQELEAQSPQATALLVASAGAHPEAALELAPTLARWLGSLGPFAPVVHAIDDILAQTYPFLAGAVREAAAERMQVQVAHGLQARRDFEPLGEPDPNWAWPSGKSFPPADTLEGVTARLMYLRYNCGPATGQWNPQTRRALARWQLHECLEPTGQLDAETLEQLDWVEPPT